ncbi:MFS transporter, partial [Curtobacterium sp. 22159]
ATFFRQIGGTLGTAVLLSVLFSVMPSNILHATADRTDLRAALDAATTPTIATASENRGVMAKMWSPIVTPLERNVQSSLDAVTAKVTQSTAAAPQAVQQQALAAAASQAHATVQDGKLTVDWSNAAQRSYWVDELTPAVAKQIDNGKSSGDSASSTNDTSFLTGADSRLTRPFMTGFNASAVTIYWVGLGVILLAFVLTWFFRVPPLRQRSALQERADAAAPSDVSAESELEASAGMAAAEAGSFTGPMTGSTPTQRR